MTGCVLSTPSCLTFRSLCRNFEAVDRLIADGYSVRVLDKYPERYRVPLLYGQF